MNSELLDLEDELTEAEQRGDRARLSELVADDFIGISPEGKRVDKAGYIASYCDARLHLPQLKIEDLIVKADTNAGLVIGKSSFTVCLEGDVVSGAAQYFDYWQRTPSGWKLVASSVAREQEPSSVSRKS